MHSVDYTYQGVKYEAEYDYDSDDSIIVVFPDQTLSPSILLGSITAQHAATGQLRSYRPNHFLAVCAVTPWARPAWEASRP